MLTLIQLYQRHLIQRLLIQRLLIQRLLIQDDTGLIQNCINRLKTYLCDTNFYNRVKNDTTLYQRVKKVYQRVLDDTKVYQHPSKFFTKCSLSRLFMFLHPISSRISQPF